MARAKAEVAKRGLVVTVVQGYYGLIAAQRKYANVQQAAAEAQQFLALSQKLENGGEVAHADVIKAQIQFTTASATYVKRNSPWTRAGWTLAVLLFPDFNLNFTLVDDAQLAPPLISFDGFVKAAQRIGTRTYAPRLLAFQAAKFELPSGQSDLPSQLTLEPFLWRCTLYTSLHMSPTALATWARPWRPR